jgi:hypothetical protein
MNMEHPETFSGASAEETAESLTKDLRTLRAEETLLRFFEFAHLPHPLQAVSSFFALLALRICSLPRSAERTVALRKLLESKDAAVRAALPAEPASGVAYLAQAKAASPRKSAMEIANGVLYQAAKDEVLRQRVIVVLDECAGQSVELQYEALAALAICTCSPACPHHEQLGSQHVVDCPRYRLIDTAVAGIPIPPGETP